MALPPKGDPRRYVGLSARWCYVVGGLALIPSLLSVPFMISTGFSSMKSAAWTNGFFFWMVLGGVIITCGVFIKRRRLWAVVTALVIASLFGSAFTLMSLLMSISVFFALFNSQGLGPFAAFFSVIPLLISVVLLACCAMMIYHLARAFKGIRMPPIGLDQGFEPIMMAERAPVEIQPTQSEDRV